MSWDMNFTDTVSWLGDEPDYVDVNFWEHAANYRLAKSQADFDRQLGFLNASLKGKKPVSVVVRGTEIVSVSAQ